MKRFKKIIFVAVITNFNYNVTAQSFWPKDKVEHSLDLIAGYQYQKFNAIELGIAFGSRGSSYRDPFKGIFYYDNFHICGEILFTRNSITNNICGIKAGYTKTLLIFNATGETIFYTDRKKSAWAVRPEIGLSAGGNLNINYGYNFFISPNKLDMGKHVLSIKLTAPINEILDTFKYGL